MANHKWNSRTSGFETAVWAAKLALSFLGIVSFGAVARATVPAAAEVLASALPGSWRSLRSWIAPPYLFVAVHFIILVIWKLSGPKQHQQDLYDHHHHHHQGWLLALDRTMEQGNPMNVKILEPSPATHLLQSPSREIWRNEIPKSRTTEAIPAAQHHESFPDERLATQSGEGSTFSPAVVMKKSVVPESKSSVAVPEKEDEESSPPAPATERIKNASMEASWKIVAEKSSSSQEEEAPPAETTLQSASHDDELNRRFEDFIKRNHEQIRLPGNQRRQYVIENTTSSH